MNAVISAQPKLVVRKICVGVSFDAKFIDESMA